MCISVHASWCIEYKTGEVGIVTKQPRTRWQQTWLTGYVDKAYEGQLGSSDDRNVNISDRNQVNPSVNMGHIIV
jgi:hypothetical protein